MKRKPNQATPAAWIAASMLVAACSGSGPDAPPEVDTPPSAPPSAGPPPPSAQSVGGSSFAARCAQPGVVKCVGFDDPADFNIGAGDANGAYGLNAGIFAPSGTADFTRATRDTAVKASGESSLKFTIPSNSSGDSSGSYFTNFSKDLSVQFGENSEFFVQWRQRLSAEFLSTPYPGGGGWKQIIIGTGDTPGKLAFSCSALEIVAVNSYYKGFARMYNSCEGSTSHGPYDPFEEPFATPQNNNDFKLQNARPEPYCLYSQSATSYFSPTGNCFAYVSNEWMTFQIKIATGPRVANEFINSYVTLWIAREGKPSELVINWGPYNLSAGSATQGQKFGKVWLLPYNGGKNPAISHPSSYTWYDELIISRSRIMDP